MPTTPHAAIVPTSSTHHGHTRTDDYAWLRADNWQAVMRDPALLPAGIRDYLEAENAHTDAVLAPTRDLQARLFAEMRGRVKEDDSSTPSPDGPWAYLVDYVAGAQHPRLRRQPREGGEATTLLDVDALARDHEFFTLGGAAHSPDHRYIAYGTDTAGSEFFTIRVRDLDGDALLRGELRDTTGGVVWTADAGGFLYTTLDENHRSDRVWLHRLGDDPLAAQLLYTETDPGFFVGADATQSRDFLVISAHDHQTSELRIVPAGEPTADAVLIAPREVGVEYHAEHDAARDRLIILTNAGDAEDYELVTAPVGTPGREHWVPLVAHQPGHLIETFAVLAEHLIRLERVDGLPRLVVTRLADGDEHTIAFDEEVFELGLHPGYEYDTTVIRLTYSSMTTPTQTWDYDVAARTRTLRKTIEVPSGHDADAYVAHRVMATSHDGEQVPISVLHHRDTPLDGSAPCVLYAYGSYGLSTMADFATNRLSLVDRGWVYAIAHVRGGMEGGYRWYRDGRGDSKANTFADYVAAGRHLVAEGFTSEGRIASFGGSAGGMLVGAAINDAPELFGAAVAMVPFVDVLTTMLDDTLPLTPPEWPEWGNPIEDPDAYATIAAYSPYDNVTAQAYPHLYVKAGLTDPRVTYWEPAKWVAKLRALKTDDRALLLRTEMGAGHAGRSGRFERLEEAAEAYAFLLLTLGDAS